MKRTLLGSAAPAQLRAPLGAQTPLTIGVTMRDAATAQVRIGTRSFVLPDEQDALAATLGAMPDKDRQVVLDMHGKQPPPYRVFAGILHLVQTAGFQRATFLAEPPAP